MMFSPKFLQDVADFHIGKSNDLRNMIFLFPNKRSIIFMRRYIKKSAADKETPFFLPKMRTLSAFFNSLSPNQEASRIEQLFTLYDAYCEVINNHSQNPLPFDRFRFWGEMMLDDFDDVDLQMADAKAVFTNVERLEEIQTYFLDEYQRQVAKEIWGYEPSAFEGFKSSLKRKEGDDLVYDEFVRLTEILFPIYEKFHSLLAERKLATRGGRGREAVKNMRQLLENESSYVGKLSLIGFNTLTTSEKRFFQLIRNEGIAEFFWDVPEMISRDLPEKMQNYKSPLAKYIGKLLKEFPMPSDFKTTKNTRAPQIQIIGVPSNIMQSKVAGNIVELLREEKALLPYKVDNTTIVLPDPDLLVPLLHSLKVSPINVTMGVPIRQTPFASLFRVFIRLNMSSHTDKTGEVMYLTQNVIQLVSHPSLTALLPAKTAKFLAYLEERGRFVTSLKKIHEYVPELAFIFDPVGDENSANEAREYIFRIIDGLISLFNAATNNLTDTGRDLSKLHELRVLQGIRNAVDTLVDVINGHKENVSLTDMNRLTFFRLIERLLNKEQLNFTGSPLLGVQIMGVLETRSLDFDNVIMLSLNEKTFPPKNFVKSLLPSSIRAAYGLSTPESRELEYAWIYANLISRCNRAFLLYNSSAESKGRGGMSRYLFQTLYIYNASEPKLTELLPGGAIPPPPQIIIEKTPEIMAQLERFKSGGDRGLSVSALERFGECPVKFYLSRVKNVEEPKPEEDAIDDATLGTVVHDVLQQIYGIVAKTRNGIMDAGFEITEQTVKNMVTASLNKNWYYGKISDYREMPSEARIQIDLWTKKIYAIIEEERKREPYRLEKCEMSPKDITGEKYFDWQISPELSIRFTFFIDRVDRTDDDALRFIDYKTGADLLSVKDMENLFWRSSEGDKTATPNKAIFQLLTYAHAFREVRRLHGDPYEGKIKLEITRVLAPKESVGKPLQINKKGFEYDDSELVEEFRSNLEQLVSDIFDPTKPFVQTDDDSRCLYCQFKNVCQRNPEPKF